MGNFDTPTKGCMEAFDSVVRSGLIVAYGKSRWTDSDRRHLNKVCRRESSLIGFTKPNLRFPSVAPTFSTPAFSTPAFSATLPWRCQKQRFRRRKTIGNSSSATQTGSTCIYIFESITDIVEITHAKNVEIKIKIVKSVKNVTRIKIRL